MEEETETVIIIKKFLAGGTAGAIGQTLVAPIERARMLLQVQQVSKDIPKESQYKGLIDCLVRIPNEQGLFSLWRGNWTSVMRYFPTQALNFTFKDAFKEILLEGVERETHFWQYLRGNCIAGGAAGACASMFVYPLDFARTRLAADMGLKDGREFKGLGDVFVKIYQSDGVMGLYRGFNTSAQSSVVYRSVYFGLYDTAHDFMGGKDMDIFESLLIAQVVTTIAGIISYPFDTVRLRLMMQSGQPRSEWAYKNTRHCWTTIYKKEGMHGFFKGLYANMVQNIGAALVLVLYDELMKIMDRVHIKFD